jgi:hypothetical protein
MRLDTLRVKWTAAVIRLRQIDVLFYFWFVAYALRGTWRAWLPFACVFAMTAWLDALQELTFNVALFGAACVAAGLLFSTTVDNDW